MAALFCDSHVDCEVCVGGRGWQLCLNADVVRLVTSFTFIVDCKVRPRLEGLAGCRQSCIEGCLLISLVKDCRVGE
jgi:hypothetical protein